MTRKVRIPESQAGRLGKGKRSDAHSDAPTRPDDPEYAPPSSQTWVRREPGVCAECGEPMDMGLREMILGWDDTLWRCRGCFDARRKWLRKHGPQGRDCR